MKKLIKRGIAKFMLAIMFIATIGGYLPEAGSDSILSLLFSDNVSTVEAATDYSTEIKYMRKIGSKPSDWSGSYKQWKEEVDGVVYWNSSLVYCKIKM